MRDHPRLAEKLGIAEGDFVKVESRRGSSPCKPWWSRRSGPIRFCPIPLAAGPFGQQLHYPRNRPISNIPEYKICCGARE